MGKIGIYRNFDALPKSYEKLFGEACADAGFFSSLPWFRNLAATALETNRTVRIYGIEPISAGGEPRLALAMAGDASGRLTAAANFYTPLFNPVTAAGEPIAQTDFDLLADAIARERWHTVDLHPMPADAPFFQSMLTAFRGAGLAVQPYFCFGNWYLQVGGRSYEQYCESLPSRLKNTLKRKSRLLEEANGLRLRIVSSPEDAADAIAAYEQVYRSSWKNPEPCPAFIPGLIRTCADNGWLRMGIAYVDGQPAAAQIWITCNGVASIYKLAYDERFSGMSVGSLLTAHLMQHALDVDRVREIDYLNGDEPYKRDWMSHRRERHGMVAFNLRTMRGIAGACRHIGGRMLKDWLRRKAVRRNMDITRTD